MAGHSKWANIKRRKAAQDSKKGQAYAKVCREMIIATKIGGGDPQANFRLRTSIEKAKAVGVAKDTIEQAIAKGLGKGNEAELESLTYEGYGPGGVAILIEAATDNRNRTAGDIRSYFNKYQGNLGETGCVGWMFEEKGVVTIETSAIDEDALLELTLGIGLQELEQEENVYYLQTAPQDLEAVTKALEAQNIAIVGFEILREPQTETPVSDVEIAKPLLRLLDAIEAHEDVQAVFSNAQVDEAVLATLS